MRKLIKDGHVDINNKYEDGEVPIVLAAKSGECFYHSQFVSQLASI